jgi:hypothetical protein
VVGLSHSYPARQRRLTSSCSNKQSSIQSKLDSIQSKASDVSSSSATEFAHLRQAVADVFKAVQEKSGHGTSSPSSSGSDSDTEDEGGLDSGDVLFQSMEEVLARLDKLQQATGDIPKETRILEHLHFDNIRAREKGISDPDGGTFQWILATQDDSRLPGQLMTKHGKKWIKHDASCETG